LRLYVGDGLNDVFALVKLRNKKLLRPDAVVVDDGFAVADGGLSRP